MCINIDSLTPIKVARHYDGAADVIEFDVGRWIEAYPALTEYRVEVTGPGGAVYFPETVNLDGHVLKWTIMPSDTGAAGNGEYQIVATGSNGERKTSASARFVVREIMEGTAGETPPDPAQPWVDKVVRAAQKVEDATVHPPVIGENGNWWLWDFGTAAYVDSGKPSQGSGSGGGGIAKETDPTVPEWAKQPNPPTYTAEDVGARPADWLPTPAEIGAQPAGNYALKSEIPTVPVQSVNGKTGAVELTAEDVGAASKKSVDKLSEEKDKQNQDFWIRQRRRFSDKPIMVAYSNGADLGPINTELAYVNAAIAGFEWLKGDVQPTSDGKLIMCHDDGFTFDANGYITTYNASNSTPIHDLSYDGCMAMEYARVFSIDTGGVKYRPKVCDLEQFLLVCREFGARPYITIRKNYMDVVVPELLRLLDAYDFTENCIVNSYEIVSVKAVAEASNHRVMISTVTGYPNGTALTREKIDNMLAASPNCTVNIYAELGSNTIDLFDASKDAMDYAKSLGVVVGTAQVPDIQVLMKKGVGLFQCDRLTINTRAFPVLLCVEILNGVASVKTYNGWGAHHIADITFNGTNSIALSRIRIKGTTRDFPDGVTPNLGSIYPYLLSVTGDIEATPSLAYGCRIGLKLAQSVADIDTTTAKRLFVKFVYGI